MASDEAVKMPVWAVALVVTNVLAGAGTIVTASTWKGTIETELRETRRQFESQMRGISRKLDHQDDLRERLRGIEVSSQSHQSRMEAFEARLSGTEVAIRNRSPQ